VTPRSADVLPTAFLPKIQAVSLPSASQPWGVPVFNCRSQHVADAWYLIASSSA
jgi:hypothetical protein